MTLASIRNAPSRKEIAQALSTYQDWKLHFYQLLYFHRPKLTSPGSPAGPFEVDYATDHMGCLRIKCHQHPEYDFLVRSIDINGDQAAQDKKVLHFCEIIQQAIKGGKQKPFQRSCCGLATLRGCVCSISSQCEIHGVICVGTHD